MFVVLCSPYHVPVATAKLLAKLIFVIKVTSGELKAWV